MNFADPIKILSIVTNNLENLSIRYYLVGSVASSVYGIPRATNDVDLVAEIYNHHINRLVKSFADEFYIDGDMILEAINNKSSFNIIRDIVVTTKNFGAGSSRQQAVDCFKSLGISLIIAESYGAIYERNAINAGMPILTANLASTDMQDGEEIIVDLQTGTIEQLAKNDIITGNPFSKVQMEIYQRGGLLK